MTLGELNRQIITSLTPAIGQREAYQTARLLLEDDLAVTPTKLLLNADRVLEPETEIRFRSYIKRILDGEPPQYVVGKAHFMGLTLDVNPATLIPRPETAELVDLVCDYAKDKKDLSILDVGTGSGCIAIALARAIPFPQITAIDSSQEAIQTAQQNAQNLSLKIDFKIADINTFKGAFDIVVSNPPYIAQSEKADMEPRVTMHEPASALFVPDSDPLIFYKAIIRNCSAKAYFFEINPLFEQQIIQLLQAHDLKAQIILDSFGKKRFAEAFSQ